MPNKANNVPEARDARSSNKLNTGAITLLFCAISGLVWYFQKMGNQRAASITLYVLLRRPTTIRLHRHSLAIRRCHKNHKRASSTDYRLINVNSTIGIGKPISYETVHSIALLGLNIVLWITTRTPPAACWAPSAGRPPCLRQQHRALPCPAGPTVSGRIERFNVDCSRFPCRQFSHELPCSRCHTQPLAWHGP